MLQFFVNWIIYADKSNLCYLDHLIENALIFLLSGSGFKPSPLVSFPEFRIL